MTQKAEIAVGFGILFIGLSSMSSSIGVYQDSPVFYKAFQVLGGNPILGILVGAVVTAIIQSSSASVGILQTLAMRGIVNWRSAIFITLGQNIGTCITAILSSAGANKTAKRAAVIHLSFNVLGAAIYGVIMTIFFGIFPDLAMQHISSTQISIFHSIFNISVTILLFPFANALVKLSGLIIREELVEDEEEEEPEEIAEGWKVLKRLNTKALKSEDAREVLKSVMESGSVDQNLQIEGDTLIKYLGADAFVEVPDGIQIIADSAFEYCMEVQEVHLPDSVERIGKHAFQGSGIKKIHLPESIKTIDIYAFSGTPLEYIELPENLQKLGHSAFRYCRMLKKAKFPEHLVEIPHDTFNDCGKLREVILPHDTEVIGAHAFSGCAALEQVDLPESVKRIEEGAFVTCVSLEKVHLPKGLEVVERKVFYRCTNLKELHFPKRVTEFGKGIFSQCSALKRVYIEGNPVDEEVFQDWDMWTTCYDMEEIIAPNMRITRFAKEWRMWAAAGLADYLVEQGDVRSEILDSYVKDLKENRSSYEVLLLENKKLLQFFIHYNLLAEQAVNRLLNQSLQKSDMEIRSMLLNYQDEIQNEDKKEETGSQLDQLLAALS